MAPNDDLGSHWLEPYTLSSNLHPPTLLVAREPRPAPLMRVCVCACARHVQVCEPGADGFTLPPNQCASIKKDITQQTEQCEKQKQATP